MFYTKELSWGALQRGGADVLGFLEKEKETALGSTTCLGGELLRFGKRWHRIFNSLDTSTRMHWGHWEQCQMMANCDLSRFLNSSKGGKPDEASFYLLPADRLRAQDPKGYRNCLNSSALFWWPEPARAQRFGLVWDGKKTRAGGETKGRDLLLGSGKMRRGLKSCSSLTLMKLIFTPFLEINEVICVVVFSHQSR